MKSNLKTRTAGSLKWNLVDKLSTQVLYAITGIVLARELSQEDFGLVGAVLVFQAFASLLVDSGFSFALLQKQRPTRLDYSSVLWFNLAVAATLYVILFLGAPLVAACFGGDERLIPLSRVMFLSLILNASIIVQTNRLMKAMDVRMVAASNFIGLVAGGLTGIYMALAGYGAWAVVWQTIVMGACKAIVLWTSTRWRPMAAISWTSLRGFFGIGSKMMFTSFLNTLLQYIYSFFIGNRVGLVSLGYYTQADKWSKMGISSLSQVLTSTFIPTLSAVQDQPERFRLICSKMNRFTSYLLFPAMIGLMVMARPIFHTLFGSKWDPSIILFQLLLLRGIFTVLISLYNNYLLALGHARTIMHLEIVRDSVAVIAIIITLPYMALTHADDPVYGITILLWGQVAATVFTWGLSLIFTVRAIGTRLMSFVRDMLPYVALTGLILPIMHLASEGVDAAWLKLTVEVSVGATLYIGANLLLRSRVQKQVFDYLRGRKID